MSGGEVERHRAEVASTIRAFFEAGKNKDFPSISNSHADASIFSKFGSSAPYTRQNSDEAFIYEQATFANISDYEYEIDDLRVDLVGHLAIATFYLTYKGVFVNNYSFEGKPVGGKERATMVLAKFGPEWKIVHSHVSIVPEWKDKR